MVFILFCKVTSCGKNAGLFQKVMQCYVMVAVEFLIMLFNWVTIFIKVDEIENFKVEICCTECVELANITF